MIKNSGFIFIALNVFIYSLMASSIPNKLSELEYSFRIGNVSHITDADLKINGPILTHALMSFIENDNNPLNDIFAESLIEKKFLSIFDREKFCLTFSNRIKKRIKANGFMDPQLIEKFNLTKEVIGKEIKTIIDKMNSRFPPVQTYKRNCGILGLNK